MRRSKSPEERRAILRMLTIAVPNDDHGRQEVDPVAYADAMTSMSDARAALSLARGVPIETITRLGYSPLGWGNHG